MLWAKLYSLMLLRTISVELSSCIFNDGVKQLGSINRIPYNKGLCRLVFKNKGICNLEENDIRCWIWTQVTQCHIERCDYCLHRTEANPLKNWGVLQWSLNQSVIMNVEPGKYVHHFKSPQQINMVREEII